MNSLDKKSTGPIDSSGDAVKDKLYKAWLVCYDVEDNKVRRRLFEALKDIGLVAVQKSVFWGLLNEAEFRALKREARTLLDDSSDRIFWVSADLSGKLSEQGIGYKNFSLPSPDGYDVI